MNIAHQTLRFGRRLRRPDSGRVPVTVVTGFLGSGKTSLIKRLIETPAGEKTAIIVNEFGEIGFDQAILSTDEQEAILLGNGCLCCSIRTDLQETMRALFVSRMRGSVDFRRVIIETSGVADPGPLLQTFLTDRALAEEFHLNSLIGVVDPLMFETTLASHPIARKQIALSDRIIMTKADLVTDSQRLKTERRVQALAHGRPVQSSRSGQIDPPFILAEDMTLDEGQRYPSIADEASHDGIISFPIIFNEPVRWDYFAEALRVLTQLRGKDILRIKGLVAVAEASGPVMIQAVQHLIHPPLTLQEWPDQDQRSRLTFITNGVTKDQVTRLFDAVLTMG